MIDKRRLLNAFESMPDESFAWVALTVARTSMGKYSNCQIWPEVVNGFTEQSRLSIIEARAAAIEYIGKMREELPESDKIY